MMITFAEFLKMMGEELWYTSGPQDNPGNPGTKRKNPTNWLNKRYGLGGGGGGVSAPPGGAVNVPVQPPNGGPPPGAKPPSTPPPTPRRMKKP